MPIYEYRCNACGHLLEAFQKITEEPLKICPNCQKPTLNKLISSTSFQLKGTGWYKTDFSNKGKPPENTTDASKTSASETTDTTKTKDKTSDKASASDKSSTSSPTDKSSAE